MAKELMTRSQRTPFDSIENALEYVDYLLESAREAQRQVEIEILHASSPQLVRRKQALQLIHYKLDRLNSHVGSSQRLLKDLRKLRRLISEEREAKVHSATA